MSFSNESHQYAKAARPLKRTRLESKAEHLEEKEEETGAESGKRGSMSMFELIIDSLKKGYNTEDKIVDYILSRQHGNRFSRRGIITRLRNRKHVNIDWLKYSKNGDDTDFRYVLKRNKSQPSSSNGKNSVLSPSSSSLSSPIMKSPTHCLLNNTQTLRNPSSSAQDQRPVFNEGTGDIVIYAGPKCLNKGVDDLCFICARVTDERDAATIVICDNEDCSAEVHLACLHLSQVPTYTWFCSAKCHQKSLWAAELDEQRMGSLKSESQEVGKHMSSMRSRRPGKAWSRKKKKKKSEVEDYHDEARFNGHNLPSTLPVACDPRCSEWRRAVPIVITPGGFSIYELFNPSQSSSSSSVSSSFTPTSLRDQKMLKFIEMVDDDIARNGYRNCGTFDTENISHELIERPYDGVIYSIEGTLEITLIPTMPTEDMSEEEEEEEDGKGEEEEEDDNNDDDNVDVDDDDKEEEGVDIDEADEEDDDEADEEDEGEDQTIEEPRQKGDAFGKESGNTELSCELKRSRSEELEEEEDNSHIVDPHRDVLAMEVNSIPPSTDVSEDKLREEDKSEEENSVGVSFEECGRALSTLAHLASKEKYSIIRNSEEDDEESYYSLRNTGSRPNGVEAQRVSILLGGVVVFKAYAVGAPSKLVSHCDPSPRSIKRGECEEDDGTAEEEENGSDHHCYNNSHHTPSTPNERNYKKSVVTVDDSNQISFTLKQGEKCIVPKGMKHSVKFGAGCVHMFAVDVFCRRWQPRQGFKYDEDQFAAKIWPILEAWEQSRLLAAQNEEIKRLQLVKAREACDLRTQLTQREHVIAQLRDQLNAQQESFRSKAAELSALSDSFVKDLGS